MSISIELASTIRKSSSWLSAVLAAVAIGASSSLFYEGARLLVIDVKSIGQYIDHKVDVSGEDQNLKINKINYLVSEIERLDKTVNLYTTELSNIKGATIKKSTLLNKFIDPVNKDFQSLKQEIKELKKLIVSNPETSLSLSKISQEIEFLKKSNERIYSDFSNYSNIGMWLIGILITISLSLFGLVIAVMIKGKA